MRGIGLQFLAHGEDVALDQFFGFPQFGIVAQRPADQGQVIDYFPGVIGEDEQHAVFGRCEGDIAIVNRDSVRGTVDL